jgi:hypothetical protein
LPIVDVLGIQLSPLAVDASPPFAAAAAFDAGAASYGPLDLLVELGALLTQQAINELCAMDAEWDDILAGA